MFIDYLTLVMIALIAGLGLLIYFLAIGLDTEKGKSLAPAFGVIGLLGLVSGLHMALAWPLPGSYNIPFGEATALFGAVFLAAAFALAKGWDLYPTTLLGFFFGIYAVIAGWGIIQREMTDFPMISGVSYIVTGAAGILSPLAWKMRDNSALRIIGIILLLVALGLWGFTFAGSLLRHLGLFSEWLPPVMR